MNIRELWADISNSIIEVRAGKILISLSYPLFVEKGRENSQGQHGMLMLGPSGACSHSGAQVGPGTCDLPSCLGDSQTLLNRLSFEQLPVVHTFMRIDFYLFSYHQLYLFKRKKQNLWLNTRAYFVMVLVRNMFRKKMRKWDSGMHWGKPLYYSFVKNQL